MKGDAKMNEKDITSRPWAGWLEGTIAAMNERDDLTGMILLAEHDEGLLSAAYQMNEDKAIRMMGKALVHYHDTEKNEV